MLKAFIITFLIIFIILIAFIVLFINKYNTNKQNNIIKKISYEIKSCLDDKLITLKYFNNELYDIFIETQYNICYIKVFTTANNKILKIDLNDNFYLLNYPTDPNPYRINIDDFLNIKSENTNKRIRKVIIFYPSLQEKIYYKSKYNVEFIKKEEENKGCNILNKFEIHDYFKDFEIHDYSNDLEI